LQEVANTIELDNECFHLWVSNLTNWSKRDRSFSPLRESVVEQVTPEMIVAEIDEFKKFFAKELVVIHEQGYDLVEVRWGLINYIN
jgi:hypothetical protein